MTALIPAGNASGTGSLTLQAPNTNSNLTATLPAASGTVLVSGNQPAFSAWQNTQQSGITQLASYRIAFDSTVFDTASCFNPTGATAGGIPAYAFQPNVAGYYQISGAVSMQTLSGSAFILAILFFNGSPAKQGSSGYGASGTMYPQSSVSALIYFNGSTDYVNLYSYGDNGTPSYSMNNNVQSVYFSGVLVRAA